MDRVERITGIIGLMISRRTPWSAFELGSELKIDKSSISRVMASLEKQRWVKKLPNESYTLGDRMLELSLSVISGIDVRRVSLSYLYELNNQTRETVGLAIRVDCDDMVIDQVESQNPFRYVLKIGVRKPLWRGATGKAILANMEQPDINEVCSRINQSGDRNPVLEVKLNTDKFRKELVLIRKLGYALSVAERSPATSAVAAPIFERNKITGAVFVTGPSPRFDESAVKNCSKHVIQVARNISMRLGSSV